jgi:hypothetical protein
MNPQLSTLQPLPQNTAGRSENRYIWRRRQNGILPPARTLLGFSYYQQLKSHRQSRKIQSYPCCRKQAAWQLLICLPANVFALPLYFQFKPVRVS